MKATDLRIGNIVNYGHGSIRQGTIYCLNYRTATIGNAVERTAIKYEVIYGIPLTPELLEKAGFECVYEEWYRKAYPHPVYGDMREYLWISVVGRIAEIGDVHGTETHIAHIAYLHTLQNSWAAVTGTELTLSEGNINQNK